MSRKKLPDIDFEWAPELAYAIGLLTTDGNLSKDGKTMTMRSSDIQLLETFKKCLNLETKIAQSYNNGWAKKPSYRVQFVKTQFYRWLLKIGLFPNKTYTIGELKVPDKYFADFLRGHLDGDGSIIFYRDNYNKYKGRVYTNNRLYLKFISASPHHISWLQSKIEQIFELKGVISESKDRRNIKRVSIWILKFSKKESVKLLNLIYYQSNLPTLNRKRDIALSALNTIINEKRKEYSWIKLPKTYKNIGSNHILILGEENFLII